MAASSGSLPNLDVGYVLHTALRLELEKLQQYTDELQEKQRKYQAKLALLTAHQLQNQATISEGSSALKKLCEERDPDAGFDFYCRDLPHVPVKAVPDNLNPLLVVEGPSDKTEWNGVVCAGTISTYPRLSPTEKVGDPICDTFAFQMFEGRRIAVAIADGCNWGPSVRDAAAAATNKFVQSLVEHQSEVETIRDAGPILLRSIAKAHNAIISRQGVRIYGTTTLLGGYILPLENRKPTYEKKTTKGRKKNSSSDEGSALTPEPPQQFGCTIISVGDCKVFRWSARTHRFIDVTKDNLRNAASIDTADPGGRLGPFVDDSQPDLRNMYMHYTECDHNDLILFLSDGVHCNLSPEFLGVGPGVLCDQFHSMSWDEAVQANKKLALELRETFMASKLEDIIFSSRASDPAFLHDSMLSVDITPPFVNETILNYCNEITAPSRAFMEEHPMQKQPIDYRRYPGKMDHATCVTIRINTSSEAVVTEIPQPNPRCTTPSSTSSSSNNHTASRSTTPGSATASATRSSTPSPTSTTATALSNIRPSTPSEDVSTRGTSSPSPSHRKRH
ncbi:cyclophilin B [Pelomyxa schiedti]|nr:cyclophilin B [Pelomyxa schiedti]